MNQIHTGDIQLPDFQRGWVWDDDHIRSLIASVSLSYPIGSVMLLETGGDGARFKPRLNSRNALPIWQQAKMKNSTIDFNTYAVPGFSKIRHAIPYGCFFYKLLENPPTYLGGDLANKNRP